MELIDVNVVKYWIARFEARFGKRKYLDWGGLEYFMSKMPLVDAVPVVHCKECIRRSTRSCPMYFEYWSNGFDEPLWEDSTIDDGYCNYGSDGNE